MQHAIAGLRVARNFAGGRAKMSVSEATMFSLLMGVLIFIVVMFADNNDGGAA
jgi:hypothetical protein